MQRVLSCKIILKVVGCNPTGVVVNVGKRFIGFTICSDITHGATIVKSQSLHNKLCILRILSCKLNGFIGSIQNELVAPLLFNALRTLVVYEIAYGNKSKSKTPLDAKHKSVWTLLLGHGLSIGHAQLSLGAERYEVCLMCLIS